jgi:hypothetical protein
MIRQTLFIPKLIHIEFRDKNNTPLNQENILIGIRTRATHKNDIYIYPFLTNESGYVDITKEQIKTNADNFISYGLMDYLSLESAKPLIDIYYWGNKSIDNYLQYNKRVMSNEKKDYTFGGIIAGITADFIKEMEEIGKRERDQYTIFKDCYNLTTHIEHDIVLVSDVWDKENVYLEYHVTLPL